VRRGLTALHPALRRILLKTGVEIMAKKKSAPHLLIVEARFYDDMSDALLDGAKAALDEAGATYDIATVPGALEIPPAISMALDAADEEGMQYDGFVALGMVIRGETYHFDIVANESSRALMDLSVSESLPIGNGILTVENEEQAWARARRSEMDKGGFAARAALTMIALKKKLGN
jgi:6,7-dimethyl-8-ribityllumazine synthase